MNDESSSEVKSGVGRGRFAEKVIKVPACISEYICYTSCSIYIRKPVRRPVVRSPKEESPILPSRK